MARYARTLFVYKYLKSTGKLTTAAKNAGEDALRRGYQHMMRYKKTDGGFGVFFDQNVRLNAYLEIF